MIAKDLALLIVTVAHAQLVLPRASDSFEKDLKAVTVALLCKSVEKLICLFCFVLVLLHVESPAFHFLC